MKFKTMDEVVEKSMASDYGLGAAVCTKSLDKAMEYTSRVRAGTIW